MTIEKAVKLCKAFEITAEQKKAWATSLKSAERVSKGNDKRSPKKCSKCNTQHNCKKCPAYGKICHRCRKKHHFATCCKARLCHRVSIEGEIEDCTEDFAILEVNSSDKNDWVIPALVQGNEVSLKVDTGSQVNILPIKLFQKIAGGTATKPDASILRNYSGGVIAHIGTSTSCQG